MEKMEMKHLFWILYVCLFVSVLVEVLLHFSPHFQAHAAFVWQEIPGFSAVYGFIGCILIIVVSKALGHHWLQKEEDYYENH
ncbi:MAG TPA: hypothetical protein VMW40_03510 [Candidatus Bathyarchaeia archaeon]|nr:hypothetical protein [Candidatus Bathyarchaeia archaeon]